MTHPILESLATVEAALKNVADANPTFMSVEEKATALADLVRLESRLVELRLRVMADAGDVAETHASRDAADWLATTTHIRGENARADLALAQAVDRRWHVLSAALRDGDATIAQAQVIARTLDALPDDIGADVLDLAESTLVGYTADFGPRHLTRLGRHILEVVAPEIADEAEARRLAALEAAAHRHTRLTLRRVGDGTTRFGGRLPDAAADRLATYLQAFTNPRKATDPDTVRLPYPRRLGEAFCQLLETIDPKRLPLHGGDATTVIVTIPLDALRADLGTAEMIGASDITADQARRLACTAKILPAVLGTTSEILDLGRSTRLFTAAQRKALLLRDRECRAQGCDIPGTWCEAHHWLPWSHGGHTDLDHGILLCHHHHHRAHDPKFTAERLPNGDVRFSRRT